MLNLGNQTVWMSPAPVYLILRSKVLRVENWNLKNFFHHFFFKNREINELQLYQRV